MGTGFLVGADGRALTNDHVVAKSGRRRDARMGGRAVRWTVVRRVPAFDLAWVRVHPLRGKLVPLDLALEPVPPGVRVWAVGFAGTLQAHCAEGTILRREQLGDVPVLVHSAQTWWGSSGSPLITEGGRVVAVHFGWDDTGVVGGGLLAVEPFRALEG
jgi:S1-C subfamily serine protease